MLEDILKELGFSDTAIAIYNRLLETGTASARQLAENLSLPRPTVYDNLKILIDNGLVLEKNEDNKKIFGADDPKNLQNLLQTKIDILNKNKREIAVLMSTLQSSSRSLEPKIKFYSGVEGIKQVLKDMLWHENIETVTMWPISEMVAILGKEYLETLNRRRIRQKISIRGIWPRNKAVDFKNHPFLGVGKGHLRELRLAPKEMNWDMSYWQYADKVAFISSRAEGFGFVVHSRDFVNLIKTQFEQIWKLSKPIKPQPQYTDAFLKTI